MIDEKKLIEDLKEKIAPERFGERCNAIDVINGVLQVIDEQPQVDLLIPRKPDKPLEDETWVSKEFLEECKEVAKKYKKPMTEEKK